MRESIHTLPQDVVPLRVLLAVHGHEPTEWTQAVCRVVSGWTNASVRVLGVVDVPSPPFTSLLPPPGASMTRHGVHGDETESRAFEPRPIGWHGRSAPPSRSSAKIRRRKGSPTRSPITRGAGLRM